MQLLDPDRLASLRGRFLPDRPGPLVGLHVIQTGYGAGFADRWPDPQGLVLRSASNCALSGEPSAFSPEALTRCVDGLVDAAPEFEVPLRRAFADLAVWDRIILALRTAPRVSPAPGIEVRRIRVGDAFRVWALDSDIVWIADPWGGPTGLAASGLAWGAFEEAALVSVAAPFFVGDRFEDIGVVTEAPHRGRGLSLACAGEVAREIRQRGRTPSWSTSPDNEASLSVARKLGFEVDREDRLYVVGEPIPEPPRRPDPT